MQKTLYTGVSGILILLIAIYFSQPEWLNLVGYVLILLLLSIRGILGEIKRTWEYGFIGAIVVVALTVMINILY